ncbi:MAG: hypothetical protein SO063_08480 [Eubacteriales bacterium]|nr:hypothetical protein [Clostridiales bacterium]MDY5016082.1 hypothetical protein [Eubacteriales bacterium]
MADKKELTGENPEIAYEKLFRTALFGFSKEDVLAYLERLARARRKENERYASHIRSLEASGAAPAAVPAENLVLASENEALKSENEMLKLRIEELEAVSSPDQALDAILRLADTETEPAASPAVPEPAASCNEPPAAVIPSEPSAAVPSVPETPPASDGRVRELEEKLAASEEARHTLEEKLRAYELEKARLAEIEESAHARARAIETEAQDRTAELRAQVSAETAALRDALGELSGRLDETSRAIYAELSASGTRYSELRRSTDELRALLDRF